MNEFNRVKDSGERQEFNTGSRRDTREGKGRYDLLPAYAIYRLAKHFENGSKKYGDDIEEWKIHPVIKHIEISNLGKVRRLKDKKVYKTWLNKWGYVLVSLTKPNKSYQLHRLVMETFVGISKLCVNHKDFNKQNNRLDNLEYVTYKENMKHSVNGGRHIGTLKSAKITFEIAQEIRKRVYSGEKQNKLAKEFKLSVGTINDIIKERIWKKDAKIHKNESSRNWEKGMPLSRYLDSAIRHLFKYLEGDRSEDHISACSWNCMAFVETEKRINDGTLPKELDDITNYNYKEVQK